MRICVHATEANPEPLPSSPYPRTQVQSSNLILESPAKVTLGKIIKLIYSSEKNIICGANDSSAEYSNTGTLVDFLTRFS
jgi:hypothetical protein